MMKKRSKISLGLALTILLKLALSQSVQAASLVIADSESEFSDTQGQENWYYGYYNQPSLNLNFQPMTQYENGAWWVQEGTFWTNVRQVGGHGNGIVTSGGRQSVTHWAVRRWVSEVEGEISISGLIAKFPGQLGGNGIMGHILVDSVPIWSQFINAQDAIGVNYTLTTSVKKGALIDFAIDPFNDNDRVDSTQFTATISTEVSDPQPVPEPSCLLGLLTFTLVSTRILRLPPNPKQK